ncbi:MAG TPA: rRNA maturation RNase YbeY [Spongiibacteraceae bacterium]|nr:rRNA maturation RNase YbeY [Spongiibacteraceae bacterium]
MSGKPAQLRIDIENVSAAKAPTKAKLKQWIAAAIGSRRDKAEISVRITDADEIQTLNREYRGKDYATNVLSFPADLPPELKLPHLGDIVICADVVEREAREQNKSSEAHWAHMLVHGTLHLLGYDHIDDVEAEAMEALEIDILRELNFDNPYTDQLYTTEDETANHG